MDFTSREIIFEIENVCNWNLETHKTVYPPREDTYLLANAILKMKKHQGLALEIGCGSGALSMLLASLGWEVMAYDVNPYAVACARGNVKKYGFEDTVKIEEGGITENIKISDKIDLIVWNLPYLDPVGDDENKLEYIEEAAYLDIENGGWSRRLIDTLEMSKISNECLVMLLFRTLPESNSYPSLWNERGWSGRRITEELIGDEKLEVYAFWRPGKNSSPIVIEECRSTMDEVKKIKKGDWGRIMTKRQTRGRGRRGDKWQSDEGDMLATWNISKSHLEKVSPGILQITAGASIAAILKIGLKWPNDLMSNDFRKMGGVVIESDSGNDYLRVGVGVNKRSNLIDDSFSSSGWIETLGEVKNIDIYNMADISLSSSFEEHNLLPDISTQEMIEKSWKALSEIISRGVSVMHGNNDVCRIVGISEKGELEILGNNRVRYIDDLENIEWKYHIN